jgi:hypothetical protein
MTDQFLQLKTLLTNQRCPQNGKQPKPKTNLQT